MESAERVSAHMEKDSFNKIRAPIGEKTLPRIIRIESLLGVNVLTTGYGNMVV